MIRLACKSFVALFLFSVVASASEPLATWTQWRGPSRDGRVSGTDWPNTLKGNALQVRWKIDKMGPSYSGPLVSEDRVFTTETVDKKYEVVRCLDRKTGKELWRKQWEGSMKAPFFAARNGDWIRSTPAYDGQAIFVGGIRDVLICLEAKSGTERWRIDFPQEMKTKLPDFGFVCSPLVDDKAVYVQAGEGFVKVDKRTGRVLWMTLKDGGGMMGSAFASPIFAKLGGKDQIVVQTRTKLAGVDIESGKEIWSKEIPSFRGMNILTPTIVGDQIFTSTYGGNTRAVAIENTDGKFTTTDKWSLKYEGNMTSPVVIDDHAYVYGKDRRLICVDLKSGKECWRTEKRFGEYWNLVAQNEKILALDQTGKLYLIQANPKEFQLLDERDLGTPETWAHLAVCGDEIYIRDLNGLTSYQWKKKE